MILGDMEETLLLCGEQDSNFKELERRFGVQVFARSSPLAVRGSARKVDQAIDFLEDLRGQIVNDRREGDGRGQSRGVRVIYGGKESDDGQDVIFKTAAGKPVRSQTPTQKKYVEAMGKFDLVMSVGPAGTGKTFLAVVCALRDLQAGRVGRIVLTRPVVEAGEKLGFLPGDLYEKINPYLRPLYDAFHTLLGLERFRIYRDDETI